MQIERGVERVGEAHEIRGVGRLDADVDVLERRVAGIGGTIVAFKFVASRLIARGLMT